MMNKSKSGQISVVLLWGFLFLGGAGLFGQESRVYGLSPLRDGAFAAAAIGLNVAAIGVDYARGDLTESSSYNRGKLPVFDQWSAAPYNHGLDVASEVFQWTAILSPALLLTAPKEDWAVIGVMYLESAALAYGAKELGKALVTRYRPYNYFSAPRPDDARTDSDFGASFFSGHTTMAFNGAAFVSTVFCAYFEDSPWKIPVVAGSFSLAAATGALRMGAGRHFFSDVLTGAVIGSATGFLVPLAHRVDRGPFNRQTRETNTLSVSFAPGVLSASCWF